MAKTATRERTLESPPAADILAPKIDAPSDSPSRPIDLLKNIEVQASVELGRVDMPIGEVLKLIPGSVVHLEKIVGEPVDLKIKDTLIARGEVVVVDDKFGLRIIEIVARDTS
jgi:flagellar motor switch protein FliN/FliY